MVLTKRHFNPQRLAGFIQNKRILFLSTLALITGAMSVPLAKGLVWLIATVSNFIFYQRYSTQLLSLTHHHLGPWVIFVPALGGLVIGFMARFGTDKIRGHGIPEALEAILFGKSQMSLRVAFLKPLSSAISIGTGGPFGAEGPIIMTGGAFGSLFAQCFSLSSIERRILLVAGAAAGMSAVFATPVAAVLLAVELLLFEWRPRSFIPVAIASATAATLRPFLFADNPVFPVVGHAALSWPVLCTAVIVGALAGGASGILTGLIHMLENRFEALPVHWMWWPALGGLVVGAVGFIDPRALGIGYELIHQMLLGQLIGAFALGLAVAKSIAWCVALGSGTSGGVLAPLLVIGGALGAWEASWLPTGDAGLWAAISMAAVLGATLRSPLTAILLILEATHDINILLALMIGCVVAYAIAVYTAPHSILIEKIKRQGYPVSHEYGVDVMTMLYVKDVMDSNANTILQDTKISALAEQLKNNDSHASQHQAFCIVDDNNLLTGIITRRDIVKALQTDRQESSVLDAGVQPAIVTYPDALLLEAINLMAEYNIGRLPVVMRDKPNQLVGYLGRSALISARSRFLPDETKRSVRFRRARRLN